jgi:hypothetical protein
MKTKLLGLIAAVAMFSPFSLGCSSEASAEVLDWSLFGSGYTGSGTLTIGSDTQPNPFPCSACNPGIAYIVMDMSGELNGDAITLIAPNGFEGNNNDIYLTAPYLDAGDLGFMAGGIDYNVALPNGFVDPSQDGYYLCARLGCRSTENPVNFSISATPLPSTWLMLLSGFLALGFFAHHETMKNSAALAAA